MMFFDHPDDLLKSYFSEWIGTKELAFFDTALCCKSNRTHFIELVARDAFILRNMEVFSDCFYLDWIVLRKIKLSAILLKHSDFYNLPDFVYQMGTLVKLQSVFCDGLFRFLEEARSITLMTHLYLDYSEIVYGNDTIISRKLYDFISEVSCLRFLSLPDVFRFSTLLYKECLKSLESLKFGQVDSIFFEDLLDYPNLTEIDCKWDCGYESTARPDFTTKNRSLRKIVIDCWSDSDLDEELFLELVNSVSNLFHVDIDVETYHDDFVKVLMDNSPKIRFLRLVGTDRFLLSVKSVEHIARSGGSLTSLHLPGCDVTDEGLVLISKYCIQLTTFAVYAADSITDAGISFILKNCTLLQSLDICSCELLTNSTAELFLKPGREFTDFDFRNTEITLKCILTLVLNPEIKIVNVEMHRNGCCNVISNLVSSCVGGLSRVDLHGFDLEFEITHLVTHLKGCHNLQRLKLSGFDQLLDEHLLEIVEACCELTHINIENNEKLTARSIKHVVDNCFQLRSLKVNKMMDLSDSDIDNLLLGERKTLRHLSVGSCKLLTDDFLKVITNWTTGIKSLALSNLPLITDEAVCTLIEKQGMVLEHLNLMECNLLTSKVIETLCLYGSNRLKRNSFIANTLCPKGDLFLQML
jgi:hypothetical protein